LCQFVADSSEEVHADKYYGMGRAAGGGRRRRRVTGQQGPEDGGSDIKKAAWPFCP
jgi:hypothetical protein